jgi:cell wall-associated NlpC family hydrolase
MIPRAEIDVARYVGIPFVDHGRSESGCDCWGLVRLIYKNEFGIDLDDLGPLYESTTDNNGMTSLYVAQLPSWTKVEAPQAGDVALLRLRGLPVHVGIVISENQMVHVESGTDCVVERFDTSLWKNRIEGFFRHAG